MRVQVKTGTGMEDDGCIYPIKFVKIDEKDGLYDGGIIWELETGSSWEKKVYRQLFDESFDRFLERNMLVVYEEGE